MSDQALTAHTVSPAVDYGDDAPIVPVGVNDLAAQRAWEHHQVARGIQRYRATLTSISDKGKVRRRTLDELEPGQVIAQDLIGPLVERIRGAQQVVMQTIYDQQRPNEDVFVLSLLPAETLAACTVLHALSKAEPSRYASTCVALGTRVQHEWEFLQWKQREAAAEKERKERGDTEPVPNLFKLMHLRNKDGVNERVFAKWRRKAPLFCKGDWANKTKTRAGDVLLSLLVESNAWFEVVVEWRQNVDALGEARQGPARQDRIFRMTDLGLDWVSQRHHRNEMMRPYLLPMICEPRDYEYVEQP